MGRPGRNAMIFFPPPSSVLAASSSTVWLNAKGRYTTGVGGRLVAVGVAVEANWKPAEFEGVWLSLALDSARSALVRRKAPRSIKTIKNIWKMVFDELIFAGPLRWEV